MGFKMKGFSGFTQKSGDYPGKDPITGGNNATYEKRSGEIMQAAKDEAKKKGYKPGTVNYSKLMEEARKKREAVADSLRAATPQKNKGKDKDDVNTLQPSEYDGIWVFKGDKTMGDDYNIGEKITDLDDRIDFIKEDQFNEEGDKKQQDKDIAKLEKQRDKLRALRNFKPGDVN
jgi:hypothetical protein